MTELPRRGLQSQMMLARELRRIGAGGMKRQIVLLGESAYEGFICIGLVTANLVIEVCDGKNAAQLTSRIEQQAEQSHRVRAARNGNRNAIARTQQLVFCCELEQPL